MKQIPECTDNGGCDCKGNITRCETARYMNNSDEVRTCGRLVGCSNYRIRKERTKIQKCIEELISGNVFVVGTNLENVETTLIRFFGEKEYASNLET